MSRFYKTSSANPLDYMYRINTPLMEKVIENNDQYITSNLQELGGLDKAATSFPFLEADQQRAAQIAQGYSKKIDDITTAIRSDPANWKKQMSPIRDVSKDLQNNYTNGEISKIAYNYNSYKKTSDYIDSQLEEYNKSGKGISADRAKAYKDFFLNQFTKANPNGTAYNPATGEYNAMRTFNPMGNIDIRKNLSDELDKLKADGTIRITDQVTGSGEYFNKETNKWEGVTPERILRIATDRLNNPQLMDYLKQDTMAGIVTGVYNTDPSSKDYGKFIAPYSYDKLAPSNSEQQTIDNLKKQIGQTTNKALREKIQQQLDSYNKQLQSRTQLNWNNDSYLAPILRGIVNEYSYGKTTEENDMSANPIWQSRFTQANENARSNAGIASREKMQQKAFDNAEKLQSERLEAQKQLKLLEWANKPGVKKPGVKPTTTATTDSSKLNNQIVSTIETNPFYYQTQQGRYSEALNTDIDVTRNKTDQLQKSLDSLKQNQPENKILIANVENQLANSKGQLSTLEDRREEAVNYAMNEWKAKGGKSDIPYSEFNENMVREYLSGTSKKTYEEAKTEFSKVEASKNSMNPNDPSYNSFIINTYRPALARKNQAEAAYTSGQHVFNAEVKNYSDTKLEKGIKETNLKTEVVSTTKTQDDYITNMIGLDPSRYKIMDSNGKELGLSFEHGTANAKNIKINGVAPSTGVGDKTISIVGELNGKTVIISPKGDDGKLNNYLATEFSKSDKSDIKNIGKIIGSPTASTINDMLTEIRLNTGTSAGTKDAWVYRTMVNPMNPNEVIKVRARSVSTGPEKTNEPKWEFQFETNNPSLITGSKVKEYTTDEDGKGLRGFVPLSSTKSKDGIYHNLEDIFSIFPSGH